MKLGFIRFFLAALSLLVIIGGLNLFDSRSPQALKQTAGKKAKCDISGFKGFPKTIEGPITLELKTLLTVLVDSDDKKDSIEITVKKSRCEVN